MQEKKLRNTKLWTTETIQNGMAVIFLTEHINSITDGRATLKGLTQESIWSLKKYQEKFFEGKNF